MTHGWEGAVGRLLASPTASHGECLALNFYLTARNRGVALVTTKKRPVNNFVRKGERSHQNRNNLAILAGVVSTTNTTSGPCVRSTSHCGGDSGSWLFRHVQMDRYGFPDHVPAAGGITQVPPVGSGQVRQGEGYFPPDHTDSTHRTLPLPVDNCADSPVE